MVCTGLHVKGIQDLELFCDDVLTATIALDKFDLDFIALGTPPLYWSQISEIRPLLRRKLECVTKSRLLLPDDYISSALDFIGAKSIALVSPYEIGETEGIRHFLNTQGYTVTAIVATDPAQHQPRSTQVYELCAEAARNRKADVIFVAGDRWPMAEHIDRLEKNFNVKVIGEIQALLLFALTELRIKERTEGFGKLLRLP